MGHAPCLPLLSRAIPITLVSPPLFQPCTMHLVCPFSDEPYPSRAGCCSSRSAAVARSWTQRPGADVHPLPRERWVSALRRARCMFRGMSPQLPHPFHVSVIPPTHQRSPSCGQHSWWRGLPVLVVGHWFRCMEGCVLGSDSMLVVYAHPRQHEPQLT